MGQYKNISQLMQVSFLLFISMIQSGFALTYDPDQELTKIFSLTKAQEIHQALIKLKKDNHEYLEKVPYEAQVTLYALELEEFLDLLPENFQDIPKCANLKNQMQILFMAESITEIPAAGRTLWRLFYRICKDPNEQSP